ncbi:MAG TPA: gephyrin-like molybdotransferase Glp [Bellilinea sp.]|nr:gephyrin-like molybdotransferase Glp [Bellilinea sp.]
MSEFLELLPPTVALEKLLAQLPRRVLSTQNIATQDALGRVLQEPITAAEPLPAFARSTVDGYALHAADTYGANESLPAYLPLIANVPMGTAPDFDLPRGAAAAIHTGGMLPVGADAVLMLEYAQISRSAELEIFRAVGVGENVLKVGEDVQTGQVVLTAGTIMRPAEIGGLLGLGITRLDVVRQPIVAILSSGDEVVPPQDAVQPGQVRDINSYSLSALVIMAGGIPRRYGIVADREDALETALQAALTECDLVVVTAGSSASSRDLTAQVVNRMGKPGVLVHGVNVKPGKPTILAVCDGKAVIGLPGNPVSALVIARLFVVPVIERLLGLSTPRIRPAITARLTVNLASQAGREDFIPVHLVSTAGGLHADPIFFKSNLIFTLARADGLVHIPADANGLPAGAMVLVELL